MATVELALRRDDRFTRIFAVKRPLPHLAADAVFRTMFTDEARLAGLIRHPNVVPVLDVGEDAEGPFLVMEYVEGQSLAEIIRRAEASGELLPLAFCLAVAAQVARGLHAAHEQVGARGEPLGLIHRDVSPQNIIVGYDGVARVTDFGIAKAIGNLGRTSTGMLKGTSGYLAPECLRFEPVDRRADLFSLGVVLFEALVGARLYRGADVTEVARHVLDDPPPDLGEHRPGVPAELVGLLFSLLAKARQERPATAADVAAALDGIAGELSGDQGPFDVGVYLDEHFAEERRRSAAQNAAAAGALLDSWAQPRRRGRLALLAAGSAIGLALIAAAARMRDGAVPAGHGLAGEYFADMTLRDLRLRRVDAQVDFDWTNASPDPGMPVDDYSVRWTGFLVPKHSEPTRICVTYDDGVRLWVNGKLMLDDWHIQMERTNCGLLSAQAGVRYPIRLEYHQVHLHAVVRLFWDSPSLRQWEVVPSSHLYVR